jgi:hypothetical protein
VQSQITAVPATAFDLARKANDSAAEMVGVVIEPMPTASTPAALRQRRHRARRKQGRFVVPVEVTCDLITALLDLGDVDEANSSDLDCVGEAIAAAARRGLDLT